MHWWWITCDNSKIQQTWFLYSRILAAMKLFNIKLDNLHGDIDWRLLIEGSGMKLIGKPGRKPNSRPHSQICNHNKVTHIQGLHSVTLGHLADQGNHRWCGQSGAWFCGVKERLSKPLGCLGFARRQGLASQDFYRSTGSRGTLRPASPLSSSKMIEVVTSIREVGCHDTRLRHTQTHQPCW